MLNLLPSICDISSREGVRLANCTSCGASNLGLGRVDLVLVDGAWYCKKCISQKGKVKCHLCGKEPFSSDEHFKTIDGNYVCTNCMEKQGIMKKYDYIMSVVTSGRPAPRTAAAGGDGKVSLDDLGPLRNLLEENLEPGEKIEVALAGNTGEGLACSSKHVFVLKSGMAAGSITAKKCIKYPWSAISGIEIKEGALYGLIELQGSGLPSYDARDINKAKQSENAVTFLANKRQPFDSALPKLKSYIRG